MGQFQEICVATACVALMPFVAMAQEQKVDDGTDPTRISSSISLSYENLGLVNGGTLQNLFLKYGTTISADRRTGLNLKLPIASNNLGANGFGVGDFSVKTSRVLASPQPAASLSALKPFLTPPMRPTEASAWMC